MCHWREPSPLVVQPARVMTQPALVEEAPRAPEGTTAPVVPVRRVQLPDPVVVAVMDGGRSAFGACMRIAERLDPNVATMKIKLVVEIDAAGAVTSAVADVDNDHLRRCVARVARSLHFPSPGQPAQATLAFFGS